MTTAIRQSVLRLFLEPTLLDDKIVIYFVYFVEPEEKFNVSV
tara:strand:+ start:109 stop:234 length:126 start_codon:yes stop_codon:yes gene_type:complete